MNTKKELNELILNEARRIGNQLLAEAKTDNPGMYWETMEVDSKGNITFKRSESIYSGVSGIVLFFLELYRQTRDTRYMDAAVEGIKWVKDYCRNNSPQNYGFFTGRMGVSYTLLKIHQCTGENEYLEEALAIARTCSDALNTAASVDDLMNGRAGILLGFLHLHAATGEIWVLKRIDSFIRHLVDHACHGPKGLYWDRSPKCINGLCGFSHGATGIGFVFLELGHYFQNDSFYRAAEQAFLYERCFFDETEKNWPDLRKSKTDVDDFQKRKKAFWEGNLEFFTTPGYMNAWCQGAAGIGLSRLRAYQLLNKTIYKNEAEIAVEKTVLTTSAADISASLFILCHGCGGNAELFLYAYKVLNDKNYLSFAEKVAMKALAFHKKNNRYLSGYFYGGAREDRSLFLGNAGIGYFYLRLLDPFHVPSILIPEIECTISTVSSNEDLLQYPFISISPTDLLKNLLKKNFNRTLFVSENIIPQKLNVLFRDNPFTRKDADISFSLTDSVSTFMKNTISSLSLKESELLSDIFGLELEKQRMDEAVKSHSLLDIKERALNQKAKEIIAVDNDAFVTLTLYLEADIRIIATRWNWNLSNRKGWIGNKDMEPDNWPILLKPSPFKIIEAELSPLNYTILSLFQTPNRVEPVIQTTINAFESLTPEQEEMLKEKIIQQIKQALLSGILVEVKNGD